MLQKCVAGLHHPSSAEAERRDVGSEFATLPAASIAYGAVPCSDRYVMLAIKRAFFGARSKQMTSEEIDGVVRAMTLTAENLETGPVKQAMQEASAQVLAHVTAMRGFYQERSERLEHAKPDFL